MSRYGTDFVIGANATSYAGWFLTTNSRDFFKTFPTLEVLTPRAFLAQNTRVVKLFRRTFSSAVIHHSMRIPRLAFHCAMPHIHRQYARKEA
jgi:hypothetical protein